MAIYEHCGNNIDNIPSGIKSQLLGDISEYRVIQNYQRTGSLDSDTFLFEYSYGSWSEVTYFSTHNTNHQYALRRNPRSSGVSIEFISGGIKQFAQQYIDKNKAMTSQWLSEKGMNKYTDKATGKELSPEEVYQATESKGEQYFNYNAGEKQGANAVKASAAAAVALSAAMMVTSKGKSLFKDPDTLKTIKKSFTGKLKGKTVDMPDVPTKKVSYTKRSPEEAAKLRSKFNSSIRSNFNKKIVDSPEKISQLKKSGFSDGDIKLLKAGKLPKGYEVHHKLPIDDSGTNDPSNLILIKKSPFHKAITNEQNALTKDFNVGETKNIAFPVPKGNIYPPLKP